MTVENPPAKAPWRRIVAIGVASAALFVLAHPPMWRAGPEGGYRYPGWDLTRVFWADLAFARRSIAEGSLPLWNPWDRGGYPFFAEPQSGMYDPVTWLLLGIALVLGTAPAWLIVAKAVIHYGIAGSGIAAFLRERRLPSWTIALGTLALLWCPRLDKLKDQSALWPTAWVGWLLLATDRVVRAPTPWRGLWLGAAVGMVINAGYPPTAFRLALLAGPWAAIIVAQRLGALGAVEDPPDRRAYLRALALALLVALGVAAALSLGQITATLAELPDTARAGMGAGHVMASHTEPAHAWAVVAPGDSITALLPYAGFAVAAGAIAACFCRGRAEPMVFVVVAAFGFVMACGDKTPVLPALAELPGFRSFRIAGHYLTLTALGLVLAGSFGLARLTQVKGELRWIGVAAAAFGVSAYFTHTPTVSGAGVVVVLLSAALVAALAFASPHRQPRIGWALVVVLGFDLWTASRPVAEILQPLPATDGGHALTDALGEGVEREVYRVADFGWAGDRVGPRHGVRDMVGHRPALTDPRYLTLYELGQQSSNILRAMNVAVVGFDKRVAGTELTRDLTAIRRSRGLFHVDAPWPLAYWTDRVAVVDTYPEARVWLRMQRDPSAAIERPDLPPHFDAGHYGTHLHDASLKTRSLGAVLLQQRDNLLELSVDAPRAGLLVIVEAWDPGWDVEVDGEPATLLRANVMFRAVALEAGEHRVVLRYRPSGVVPLWLLWLAATLALIALALGRALENKRRSAA